MLKECGVCKKQFEPCNDCSKTAYSWRKTVCCSEHSDPFIAILEFSRNLRTKESAKKVLRNFKIDYNDTVKPIVDKIMSEPKKQEVKVGIKTEVETEVKTEVE